MYVGKACDAPSRSPPRRIRACMLARRATLRHARPRDESGHVCWHGAPARGPGGRQGPGGGTPWTDQTNRRQFCSFSSSVSFVTRTLARSNSLRDFYSLSSSVSLITHGKTPWTEPSRGVFCSISSGPGRGWVRARGGGSLWAGVHVRWSCGWGLGGGAGNAPACRGSLRASPRDGGPPCRAARASAGSAPRRPPSPAASAANPPTHTHTHTRSRKRARARMLTRTDPAAAGTRRL